MVSGVILLLTMGMHAGFAENARLVELREQLNSQLEQRVAERTRELEHANARLIGEASSREAAETQLRQLQRIEAVGQLTGGLAHDFNNMLAIIIGSVQMAQRNLDRDRGRVDRFLANALEGAQRSSNLTARLLAFARQQPLDPRPVDTNKLVSGMAELLRRTLGETVEVEPVLAGGAWPTFADPTQLESAIVNLCVNARDAMPEGGRLTIETANAHLDEAYTRENPEVVAGQYALIAVSDSGHGMSGEVVSRAFDPFYTTKGAKGTGLGLSQVHVFVKQSGGHVKIYSEIGHGSTVKIYLPRYTGGEAPTSLRTSNGDALQRATGTESVLVVEDDDRVRAMATEALRDLGYRVLEAKGGEPALTILRSGARVDLLFTDVVMPDMDGRQLATLAQEGLPQMKVLFTTGYTRNAIVHNSRLDPGVSLLQKQFTLDQLAQRVREVLDRQ